jgi:hypothetical protein
MVRSGSPKGFRAHCFRDLEPNSKLHIKRYSSSLDSYEHIGKSYLSSNSEKVLVELNISRAFLQHIFEMHFYNFLLLSLLSPFLLQVRSEVKILQLAAKLLLFWAQSYKTFRRLFRRLAQSS